MRSLIFLHKNGQLTSTIFNRKIALILKHKSSFRAEDVHATGPFTWKKTTNRTLLSEIIIRAMHKRHETHDVFMCIDSFVTVRYIATLYFICAMRMIVSLLE